ncbi:MAG: hypothetical protein AAGC44_12075 [Planctomycetota bacterium]
MTQANQTENVNQPGTQIASDPGDLGGLVAAVEGKMAELMSWHGETSKQLDADRQALDAQTRQQQDQIKADRDELAKEQATLAEQTQSLDRKRAKLLELAQKLEAEQDALSREWTSVHHARELNEKLADELNRQRDRVGERVSTWLSQTAESLTQPLKLTGSQEQDKLSPLDELEAFEAEVTETEDKPLKAKAKKAA